MTTKPIKAQIIRIGNSRGLRLPKTLLELSGIQNEVELLERDGEIIIRPVKSVREGWAASFQEMAQRGDDALLDEERPSEWDETEWEWK
jgi:antitoxin MazE